MNGFDYIQVTEQISQDFNRLALLADSECKKALKECGAVYKKNVMATSGGTRRFQGIGTGARVSVKKGKISKEYFLVVKGAAGKAPLWHLANNGFIHNKSNKKIPGNHFVDKAEQMSQGEIDAIINTAVSNIIK